MSLTPVSFSPEEVSRCIGQIERKREYNRKYYQQKVKPKKSAQQQEIEQLRDKADLKRLDELELENKKLTARIQELEVELSSIHHGLQLCRQRNYELIMERAKPSY